MISSRLAIQNLSRRVNVPRHLSLENVKVQNETVDENEIMHFKNVKENWWDEFGPMKPLHSMNLLRVPLIRDGLHNCGTIKIEQYNTPHPLRNISILDVGCGGGILSEPLARLGANVTGIDATPDLIDVAKEHSAKDFNIKTLTYIHSSIEEHAKDNAEKYDAVVASEIVEHITEKDVFLGYCVNTLKPGGSIFLTTLNRTLISRIAAVMIAENLLNLVPSGTHDWNKFLPPHSLQRHLELYNCRTRLIHGLCYNFINNTWKWTTDTSINYALHAIKNKDQE